MKLFLLLAILFFNLISCGQHVQTSSTEKKQEGGRRIEKSQDLGVRAENAIFDENISDLKQLILLGWSIHEKLPGGNYPLVEACLKEKPKMVRFLKDQGATWSELSLEGIALPEWVEAREKQLPALHRAFFKTQQQDEQDVLMAIEKNQFNELKKILSESVPVNFHFSFGETPLTYAIIKKSMLALRGLFLATDLDVNLKNTKQESPLQIAKALNQKAVVAELIKRKAQE
ncbi:MAG TPA: hypothetical protein PLJ21_03770 [Pseudobdellovibrionaceae bacterium]|nr:hypothetical protein [Pseudobdellovibrionaceae bacterium]